MQLCVSFSILKYPIKKDVFSPAITGIPGHFSLSPILLVKLQRSCPAVFVRQQYPRLDLRGTARGKVAIGSKVGCLPKFAGHARRAVNPSRCRRRRGISHITRHVRSPLRMSICQCLACRRILDAVRVTGEIDAGWADFEAVGFCTLIEGLRSKGMGNRDKGDVRLFAKLNKRTVDQVGPEKSDYFLWDDELPGFGLRVFSSGKRSYLVQYRAKGRTHRFTIGPHGVWAPEAARKEARILIGRIAQGDNPAETKLLDAKTITVKELCTRYLADCEAGLVPGKGGRPKKPSTMEIDRSRIKRHILPLLGNRRVTDITSADIAKFLRDVANGKTRADVKTKKRGRAIVRGGIGTGSRGVGLLGGIFTYAIREGIIEKNPVHGFRKPKDRVRDRRLTEREYRALGKILADAALDPQFSTATKMVRILAMTGCRRGEIINENGRDRCSAQLHQAGRFQGRCIDPGHRLARGRVAPTTIVRRRG